MKFLEWNFRNIIIVYRLHLQYFEIFLKSVKSAHFNEIVRNISKSIKYLFLYKNISEC